MKTLYAAFFTLLCTISFPALAQYSGPYTVGGSSPDFETIQEAADSLSEYGISGPVMLSIRNGIYNETIELDTVVGSSATNTITFTSETSSSAAVKIQSASGSTFESVVSNLVFSHLTFRYTGPNSSIAVLDLENASNISFSNCALEMTESTSGSLISVSNNEVTTTDLSADNCSFEGGNYGFYAESNNDDLTNVSITNCFFNTRNPLYLYADDNVSSIAVDQCSFNAYNDAGTGYAIQVEAYQNAESISITNTNIDSSAYGIYVYADQEAENILINEVTVAANEDAVQLYGYYSPTQNISITASDFHAGDDGIYIYSDISINNVNLEGLEIMAGGYGIDIEGYYQMLGGISISETNVTSGSTGIYLYSYYLISNILLDSDTVISDDNGIEIYNSYSSISNVEIRESHVVADTSGTSDDGIYLYSGDGSASGIDIYDNSILAGGTGIYGYTYHSTDDVELTNLNVYAVDDEAIYFENSYNDIKNVSVSNSMLSSDDDIGFYLYTSSGSIRNTSLSDVQIEAASEAIYLYSSNNSIDGASIQNTNLFSEDDYGIYMYADRDINNTTIRNTDISSGYGIYVEGYYGSTENLVVDSSTIVSNDYYGIYVYSDYGGVEGLRITNNTIHSDTTGSYTIYVEADDSPINDAAIRNNQMRGYDGIYMEGDDGGVNTISIRNNTIELDSNGTGVYITEMGNGVSVNRNTIMGKDGIIQYGIYLDGDYNASYNIEVNENTITNPLYYGIDMEYSLWDVSIIGNTITNDLARNGMYGIYVYDFFNGNLEISKNQIICAEEYEGIQVYTANIFAPNSGWIANNFISGVTGYGIYLYEANRINVANNSLSVLDHINNLMYIDNVNELSIQNNIFKMDSTGAIFYFSDEESIDESNVNYNVYHFDTTTSELAEIPGPDVATLSEWQQLYDKDANSFMMDPQFVNDSNDLHINCSNTALKAGIALSGVVDDIDLNARAATPTIGADEIVSNNNIFSYDELGICTGEPLTLDAGYSSGASYSWSTGDTTQSITITSPGTYSVAIVDDCGTHSDQVTVNSNDPVPNFTTAIANLTVAFLNGSSGADTYFWEFGDGNVSVLENPVHQYSGSGTYTVTLSATGECGPITSSQEIAVEAVGIEENLLANKNIQLFPNPSRDQLNIRFDVLDGERIDIDVLDLQGRVLLQDQVANSYGPVEIQLSLVSFETGMYLVRFSNGSDAVVKRISKVN